MLISKDTSLYFLSISIFCLISFTSCTFNEPYLYIYLTISIYCYFRLNDILETDDIEESEEDITPCQTTKINRKVSFNDEDDSETLEIIFQHSNIEPCREPYDPAKGIQKPSDIYKAFSHLFSDQTISILKKSKYTEPIPSVSAKVHNKTLGDESRDPLSQRETIVVKDVIEKVDQSDNQYTEIHRPVSIFKKRRQQNR